MNRILNNLLMLMEKMRCLSLTEEVWRMMVGLPYAEMMEAFLSNFGFIFEEKYLPNLQLSLPCLHSNTCT